MRSSHCRARAGERAREGGDRFKHRARQERVGGSTGALGVEGCCPGRSLLTPLPWPEQFGLGPECQEC
eukprot:scaffold5495_cov376-Prasinococcus_capsulatus_cf.AAC.8